MSVTAPDVARTCSPFLDRLIQRHPHWFEALQADGRLENDSPPQPAELRRSVEASGLDRGLRAFRNAEMLRITWRELNRKASLEQTLGDLSRLAECCLEVAIEHHDQQLRSTFGTPRNDVGIAQLLVVLGLGKLGGEELNLSSDIDLVFCFPEAGHCDGKRGLSNGEYFTRLVRAVIASLSNVTAEGFCFRVDIRLRPFGEAGPIACSFAAMEQYYQREGRDWERYALVKARPVAGDLAAGGKLLKSLSPFVYRRYTDFGAVEALQEMQRWLRDDARRHGREDDIKRGPGGIREIEFLVQCFQLLRGGREPALQGHNLLHTLDTLRSMDLLSADEARVLRDDYVFLRRLENAIQALHDQQTHSLPSGEDLQRISTAMQANSVTGLQEQLAAVRRRVREALLKQFPAPAPQTARSSAGNAWRKIKQAALSDNEAPVMDKPMRNFMQRLQRLSLSARAAERLDQFMPQLLQQLEQTPLSAGARDDVLDLVLTISRRSAYLALLVQNPQALEKLVQLFSRSDWIARKVVRFPALLDELIDPALGHALPGRDEMRLAAARILSQHADPEAVLHALNDMKLTFSLRLAVAELEHTLTAIQAQALLSELAGELADACLALSRRMARGGDDAPGVSGLAVIAYGSFGAGELSWESDLDLIFLHPGEDTDQPGEQDHVRVVRRMLGLLTATTPAGQLYAVDTRLRPNGKAGLLVSSLRSFERYQREHAWTWELQALTRARWVAGNAHSGEAFAAIRAQVLALQRDPDVLAREVREMRQRMRRELAGGDPCKHAPGALVDIGFMTQLGILTSAASAPEVLVPADTPGQLSALLQCGWLTARQHDTLSDAYARLTEARHQATLLREPPAAPPDTSDCWSVCQPMLE